MPQIHIPARAESWAQPEASCWLTSRQGLSEGLQWETDRQNVGLHKARAPPLQISIFEH